MTTPTREQVSKLFKAALDKRREMSEESKGDLARWLFSEGMAVARAELEATIAEQAAELESLRKDAEPIAWGISVEGEMCDVFINKDACFLEFERRNKLYPEIPRVVVNLAIAAAPKQEK